MAKENLWEKIKKRYEDWIIIKEIYKLFAGIPSLAPFVMAIVSWISKLIDFIIPCMNWLIGIAFLVIVIQTIRLRPCINRTLLFTTSSPSASFSDIANELERVYGFPRNKMFSLLLGGYWKGDFDDKKAKGPPRLEVLQALHDEESTREHFVFAYKHEIQPIMSEDLPDGGVSVDLRPFLPVPDKNTKNWTNENCEKAFEELANQEENHHANYMWPNYVPDIIKPILMCIRIPKTLLESFLKKEKILKYLI